MSSTTRSRRGSWSPERRRGLWDVGHHARDPVPRPTPSGAGPPGSVRSPRSRVQSRLLARSLAGIVNGAHRPAFPAKMCSGYERATWGNQRAPGMFASASATVGRPLRPRRTDPTRGARTGPRRRPTIPQRVVVGKPRSRATRHLAAGPHSPEASRSGRAPSRSPGYHRAIGR